jgi:hypothetical protein
MIRLATARLRRAMQKFPNAFNTAGSNSEQPARSAQCRAVCNSHATLFHFRNQTNIVADKAKFE